MISPGLGLLYVRYMWTRFKKSGFRDGSEVTSDWLNAALSARTSHPRVQGRKRGQAPTATAGTVPPYNIRGFQHTTLYIL